MEERSKKWIKLIGVLELTLTCLYTSHIIYTLSSASETSVNTSIIIGSVLYGILCILTFKLKIEVLSIPTAKMRFLEIHAIHITNYFLYILIFIKLGSDIINYYPHLCAIAGDAACKMIALVLVDGLYI